MKPLALAAAAGAALVLASCSQGHTRAMPSKHANVSHQAVVLVNCPLKYNAWKHGPAKRVLAAVDTVDSANSSGDVPAITAALKEAQPAVASAARYPIPACADPKGYWTALLMHVNAAAASARSAPRAASIKVALKGLPAIEHRLHAELKITTG
jgi:hypothetical protein